MLSEILNTLIIVVIPSIFLFGSIYYFTNKWFEVQKEKNKVLLINDKQGPNIKGADLKKHFFPLQVEAYQRMVLFLERIAPNNMVMRLNNPGLPAKAFQQKLLENIRQEYEHNLAQQIFISQESWNRVQASKDEVSKIVNIAATQLEPTALANDLSKAIFEITAQLPNQPTDLTITYLKTELNKLI